MERYRKFWAAIVGAGATTGLTIWGPETTVGKVLIVVAAVATAAAVYALPNEPS